MKKISLSIIAILAVMGFATSVPALLVDRGGGMIYSTGLDVTWLQDANYSKTSGYSADGRMTWGQAYIWSQNLSYGGFNDWRLPNFDRDYNRGDSAIQSEMSYLRFVELGPAYGSLIPFDSSPFINLGSEGRFYWSGTLCGPLNALRFDYWCG